MGEYDEPVVRDAPSLFTSANVPTRILHTNKAAARFAGPIGKSSKCYEKHNAAQAEALKVPDLADELLDPTMRESKRITGRQRYAKARKVLNTIGKTCSPMQKGFFNQIFGAAAELLFKDSDDFETERFHARTRSHEVATSVYGDHSSSFWQDVLGRHVCRRNGICSRGSRASHLLYWSSCV